MVCSGELAGALWLPCDSLVLCGALLRYLVLLGAPWRSLAITLQLKKYYDICTRIDIRKIAGEHMGTWEGAQK